MGHKGLKKIKGLCRFFAEVQKESTFHTRFDSTLPTLCLENVRIGKGQTVTDHIWISLRNMEMGEPFPLHLSPGDTISFIAGVDTYQHGINGQKGKDYTLVRIKSIELIKKV